MSGRVPRLSSQDPVMAAFLPCPAGAKLLEAFATARPDDCEFIEPADFLNVRSSAFSGIAEWDEFADHVSGCPRCGEV